MEGHIKYQSVEKEALKTTPLASLHISRDARMVPFAGFSMPLQYTNGIIAEHNHTRKHASLFDVSHMGQICIRGKNMTSSIEALVPGDINNLAIGRTRYTMLTNDNGGILDDIMITRHDDNLFVVVNASRSEFDLSHLKKHTDQNIEINIIDKRALIALQGPKSATALATLAPEITEMPFMSARTLSIEGIEILVNRCGYTGEDGFEISVPNDAALMLSKKLLDFPYVKLAGLGARDTLRLEAGLCLYGQDLDTTTTPVEAGLIWSISKRRRAEGGFPGANTIKSQLLNGTSRMLIGIRPSGRAPARMGTNIKSVDGMSIGTITSGAFGPTVGGPVSIGYVITSHAKVGMEINLDIRGKSAPAKVVALPFSPHRYFKNTHQ